MLAASSSFPATLTWDQTIVVLAITAGFIVAAGLVVILGRRVMQGSDPDQSLVRSWIALALVAGLVLFCAVSFGISDTALQSTLFGALTASAGAAVAFYFASKNADQARQDILNATFGTDSVPNLYGLSKDEATTRLGSTSFALNVDPASGQESTATVSKQKPEANSLATKGSTIVVTLKVPPAEGGAHQGQQNPQNPQDGG